SLLLEIYAFSPSGVMASRIGPWPTGIVAVIWLLAQLITVTELELLAVTKSCAPEAADGGSVSQVSARVRRGRPRRQVAWPSKDRLRFLSDFVETGSRCFLSLFFIRISVLILDFSF